MNQQARKRVTGASLSQHLGKSVTLLGEFVQLEPNGQVFTLRTSSSDVVTVQLQEPLNRFKMRALIIRPDDAELFQITVDPERFPFFLTHLPAFKRMWAAEGKVYWLRFLLEFKSNFENTFMNRPECQFVYEMDEEVQFQSFVFINIHKKFVYDSYSVAKTLMDHIFVVAAHLEHLKEPNRIKNPFYTKETREAFRELFGTPEVDEDIPTGPIAFLSNIYSMFLASVSALLKRWLKEPDLSDEAKKNVDYTYCYWKPPPEWEDKDFWPSCFEKYLADVYGNALPKMLLTANIHNIFLNHDDCGCVNHPGDISIFKVFSHDIDHEPFCMSQVGYLQPNVHDCASHSNCYRKILHNPKCPEPYLCEGSNTCILTCEKNRKKINSESKPINFWKKITFETFACKLKNKRHVSTYVESHSTEVETFVHQQGCCKSKNLREERADEFMMNMCGDPELLNAFNQHKRKEEFKNRLRSKFHQKYCFDGNDFKDPSYRMGLYENAHKSWIFGVLDEKLRNRKYAEGSILCMESAERTVAVGTNSVLSGRIVLPTLSKGSCRSSPCACEKVNQEPPILDSSESKPKSKRSRSKKKKKANATGASKGNNDSPSTSTNVPIVKVAKEPSADTLEKKKVACSVPLHQAGSSTESENTKNLTACSAEKQQIPLTDEISRKVNRAQCDNTSKTSSKVIVKEPTSVNKLDIDNSKKGCPLLNGDINKDAEDKVDNSGGLCFGDCVPQNTIGHMCSKSVCSLKSCCQCCIFKKEKDFSTQTDTFQDCPNVITEKPKKAPKLNLVREAACLNVIAEEQLKNCSDLKYTQKTEDGDNSKKIATFESNISNSGSDDSQTIKSIEATSKNQHTIENSAVNLKDIGIQIPEDSENAKTLTTLKSNVNNDGSPTVYNTTEATNNDQHTFEESAVNLKDTGIQIPEDVDNAKMLTTTLESNVNNSDSQTIISIEGTSKDQCIVEETDVNLKNNEIQNDGDNSKKTTALECNVNNVGSDDSQTSKSIEAPSKVQHTVEEYAVNLKDTAIHIPEFGDNAKKLTTLESNVNNGGSQTIKSTEAVSKNQPTVEDDDDNSKKLTTLESNVNNDGSQIIKSTEPTQTIQSTEAVSKNQHTVEGVVNLKDTAIQFKKDDDNSKKLTAALEYNVNNGVCDDSLTFKSIEETSKDQHTVEESVVSINDTSDKSHSDKNNVGNENLVQELLENDNGMQKTGSIVEMKSSASGINDSESISDTVAQDAKEGIDNLKFKIDGDKTVEDFLTLIGILNKPSNSKEEIKSDSVASSTNHKCDTEGKDKKLKFKTCAFCGKIEVVYKTFKRCAKCKSDNFAVQRYYCSRQCQVDDWQESHRNEHLKKS